MHLYRPIMFSSRTVLLLFIFAVIAILGSTNGEPGCDPSQARQEMYDEQARASAEAGDRFNRITLSCKTSSGGGGGGGSHGNSGLVTIINLSVALFFLVWIAVGIWIVCVRRQNAINAAAIKPYPGEVGAKEMSYGMDEKTKTVSMSVPTTGKVSNGDTNV